MNSLNHPLDNYWDLLMETQRYGSKFIETEVTFERELLINLQRIALSILKIMATQEYKLNILKIL